MEQVLLLCDITTKVLVKCHIGVKSVMSCHVAEKKKHLFLKQLGFYNNCQVVSKCFFQIECLFQDGFHRSCMYYVCVFKIVTVQVYFVVCRVAFKVVGIFASKMTT